MDYGEKNIGLACTDELGLIVRPLPSRPNPGRSGFFKLLRDTIRALDIRELVLGIPLRMDGARGDAAARMEELMEAMKKSLHLPLTGIDERLSTVEALKLWRDMTPKQQKKYRTVDSLAAAFILDRYLKDH